MAWLEENSLRFMEFSIQRSDGGGGAQMMPDEIPRIRDI